MYLIRYLLYVIEHKINFFRVAVKEGKFIAAFTHDLSKFSTSEFVPYAKFFYKSYYEDKDKMKREFDRAWFHHYSHNKHHWNYWIDYEGNPVDIPEQYIHEMILDWKAMSIKFDDTAKSYYLKHRDDIKLTSDTRDKVENILGI